MSTDNHTAPPTPPEPVFLPREDSSKILTPAEAVPQGGKVIGMDGVEVPNAGVPAGEVERRAAIMLRAFELVAKQLQHDGQRIFENAIVGNASMQARMQMVDHARSLMVAAGHLESMCIPAAKQQMEPHKEEAAAEAAKPDDA